MKYRAKVTAVEEFARATAELENLTIVKDATDIWLECRTVEEADSWEQFNYYTKQLCNYYNNK